MEQKKLKPFAKQFLSNALQFTSIFSFQPIPIPYDYKPSFEINWDKSKRRIVIKHNKV